ncbi:Cu-binding protein [Dinochytrium kinnereticum]|nr:Cu-binding protein [Dinochytrium kinnereticum]
MERSNTPPELFASRTRSISLMESRDFEQDACLQKLQEKGSSRAKLDQHGSDPALANPPSAQENRPSTAGKKLQRSVSCRTPGNSFGWKSAGAFAISGLGLLGYFEYERKKAKERQEARANAAVGKPLIGGPFSLVDHNGTPMTDLDFAGKYMLLYFGYTFCPDVCPEELEKMAKALDILKPATAGRAPLVPIFISCDPKRDSIEGIKEYVKDFHQDFIGLTGTHQQIKRVAKAYRLYFSAPPRAVDDDESDYLVDHSIFFYLVGPDGKYIAHFGRQETAESMSEKILAIMNSP